MKMRALRAKLFHKFNTSSFIIKVWQDGNILLTSSDDNSNLPLWRILLILLKIIMKKYLFIICIIFMLFSFFSCKSVGGYYIRHGSGYINDTLHYRLTIPNSSNVNLIR